MSIFRPGKAVEGWRGGVVPTGYKQCHAAQGITKTYAARGGKVAFLNYLRALGWALSYTSISLSIDTCVYFWVVDSEACPKSS